MGALPATLSILKIRGSFVFTFPLYMPAPLNISLFTSTIHGTLISSDGTAIRLPAHQPHGRRFEIQQWHFLNTEFKYSRAHVRLTGTYDILGHLYEMSTSILRLWSCLWPFQKESSFCELSYYMTHKYTDSNTCIHIYIYTYT